MSFYTSLHFYRPTAPPIVTGPALAKFLRDLNGTGVIGEFGGDLLKVKFGAAIDQDDRSEWIDTPVPGVPDVYSVSSIEYDLELDRVGLDAMCRALEEHDRPIYRASVLLGIARGDIIAALRTTRPDNDDYNLCLWDVGVSLRPVSIGTLDSEEFVVGWMSVSLSGQGYLFPWTPRDLTSRAEQLPPLRPVMDLCRRRWPVEANATAKVLERLTAGLRVHRTRRTRKQMAELWPYEDLDRPWDWFWGVDETG